MGSLESVLTGDPLQKEKALDLSTAATAARPLAGIRNPRLNLIYMFSWLRFLRIMKSLFTDIKVSFFMQGFF